MPDPAPPPAPPAEKPKIDPFIQRLTSSLLNAAVDDESFTLKPLPPEDKATVRDSKMATVAEMMAAKKPDPAPEPAKEPAKEPEKPAEKPPETPPPAVEKKEEPKPAEVPVKPPVSDQVLEIQRKIQADIEEMNRRAAEEARRQTEAKPPEKPAATAPNPDEEYDKTLPEEAQEVLDVLKWADSRPEHKGKVNEYRSYLRRMDEFLKTNPEEEEVKRFELEHKPKISQRTIRTLREEQIIERAEKRAEEKFKTKLDEQLESVRKKQRELEIAPLVKEADQEFGNRFVSTTPAEGKLEPEVAKAILSNDPAALEKYDLEAPILKRHLAMHGEYVRIVSGLTELNQANPLHAQIVNFIARHEQAKLAAPEATRIRDGKAFLPLGRYHEEVQKDPSKADRYWTFSDQEIRGLMEQNVHLTIAHERKKVRAQAEKMGYAPKPAETEKVKVAEQPAKPAPVATPNADDESSPKTVSSRAPGAAKRDADGKNHLTALENLFPGMDKIISGT